MKTVVLHITDTYVARTVIEDNVSTKTIMPFEDIEPGVVKSVQAVVAKLASVDLDALRRKADERAAAHVEAKRLARAKATAVIE